MKDGLSFLPTGTGSSAEPRSARTEPDPVRAKILIVDDDQRNLLAASEVLADPAIDLVLANSPEEALRQALREDFALILLDVQMPGMDGFETAAHVKKRERTRDIPILFLTAIGDAHQAFRGYAAGAVDYLAKPFDPWVLKAKVGVFVEPASAISVAGLLERAEAGQIPKDATVVLTVTGHGLKDPQWALRTADGSDITPTVVPVDTAAIADVLGLAGA